MLERICLCFIYLQFLMTWRMTTDFCYCLLLLCCSCYATSEPAIHQHWLHPALQESMIGDPKHSIDLIRQVSQVTTNHRLEWLHRYLGGSLNYFARVAKRGTRNPLKVWETLSRFAEIGTRHFPEKINLNRKTIVFINTPFLHAGMHSFVCIA